MPFLTGKFGNASSIHYYGQEARAAVDKARHQVAALINARPNEIVFTSGGTEANNLAIRGLIEANASRGLGQTASQDDGLHVITSSIEHPAVLNVCDDLEAHAVSVTRLPVHENGILRPEELEAAISDKTILVSIMAANNEIGTLQPLEDVARVIRRRRENGQKLYFHTDAVQAIGKIDVDVDAIGCDLLSISAHKIYAPKGVGALYVRRGVRLHPQNIGGRQERERRGGTENVPNIVAFGKACEIAKASISKDAEVLRKLRDRFEQEIMAIVPNLIRNGAAESRLPTISNLSFGSVEGEGLLINLDMQGIAVSTGSACSSGSLEPSPVIRALGRTDEMARGAIRFSFGRFNTSEDVDRLIEVLPAAVQTLRDLNVKRTAHR